MTLSRIALIGYGEVGRILAEDLHASGRVLTAFDVALSSRAGEAMGEHALAHGVTLTKSHADAVRDADLIVSAVTASQTVDAARACAGALPEGSFYLDLNSSSPEAKLAAAELMTARNSRYVEGAVMAPGAYFFQRVIEHGRRRSEEMREVAMTVRDAGLEPWCATATAERQAWVADLAERGQFGDPRSAGFARSEDWRIEADRILAHLAETAKR